MNVELKELPSFALLAIPNDGSELYKEVCAELTARDHINLGLTHSGHVIIAQGIIDLMQELSGHDLPEIFANTNNVPADVMGEFLMGHTTEGNLTLDRKRYWLEVGDYMGPDHIAALRTVAAFMQTAEKF